MAGGLLVLIFSFLKFAIGNEEGFIVGGDVVHSIREFPHVAFLTLTGEDGSYICGASILNQIILITAAHCLDGITEITASVGNVNRDKGRVYQVASFEQHPKWDTDKIINDVGLCRLKKALALGKGVKRVVLMRRPPHLNSADLAGWGATEEHDYSDSVLLKHTVQKLWDHKHCRKVLYSAPRGTICGGLSHAKRGFASKGDSGSGLLIRNKIIVGLVSYKDTSVSHSLVIYTDVAYFYDWIKRTAKQLACN